MTDEKKYGNVRYIGDVHTPHLATSRRAKKCWTMAKEKLSSQKKTISQLREKLRQSIKKVTTLQDTIILLRERKLISDTTMDDLLVSFLGNLNSYSRV